MTTEYWRRILKMPTDGMEDNFRAAFFKGEDYYFTGKPCRRGHIAPRAVLYPRYYICLQCALEGHQ